MKVERVSYDVITPSKVRGILDAIYLKPQFRWTNPIFNKHLDSPDLHIYCAAQP
jgi:hypothetical protein